MRPAKYEGKCSGTKPDGSSCNSRVTPGDMIEYDRVTKRIVACPACSAAGGRDTAAATFKVRCKIQSIPFHNPDNGFTIARARFDRDFEIDDATPVYREADWSLVGRLGTVVVGDLVEASGYWNNGKYGWEFKARACVPLVGETMQALRAYLARFPQVGPHRAEAILALFGRDRDAVIRAIENEPMRLAEVPGITEERAQDIHDAFMKDSQLRETAMWLAELALPEELTARILDRWGEGAREVMEADPYYLTELAGVGFDKADEVALAKLKLDTHDARRACAAVLHLLDDEEHGFDGGHTWTLLRDIVNRDDLEDPPEASLA